MYYQHWCTWTWCTIPHLYYLHPPESKYTRHQMELYIPNISSNQMYSVPRTPCNATLIYHNTRGLAYLHHIHINYKYKTNEIYDYTSANIFQAICNFTQINTTHISHETMLLKVDLIRQLRQKSTKSSWIPYQ